MATKTKKTAKHIRDVSKSKFDLAKGEEVSFCGKKLSTKADSHFVNTCHALENLGKDVVCGNCRDVIIDILSGK